MMGRGEGEAEENFTLKMIYIYDAQVACSTYSILELLIVLSVIASDSPFLLCEENKHWDVKIAGNI